VNITVVSSATNSSDSPTTNLSDWKEKVDFGIITVREDEFAAMLQRVPEEVGIASGRRQYNLRRLATDTGAAYTVAIVRCLAQGNGEAQQVANALLEELAPRWLLVVGIAGGAPAAEFTLGDVVVSTQVCDFSVGAVLKDDVREYALQTWPRTRMRLSMQQTYWPSVVILAHGTTSPRAVSGGPKSRSASGIFTALPTGARR
jgi:hypothetical protein